VVENPRIRYQRRHRKSCTTRWKLEEISSPSTNNGFEVTNAVIKCEHTLRERAPVVQFLNSLLKLVKKWSEVRSPLSVNCIPFHNILSISLSLWIAAYQWAMLKCKVLEEEHSTTLSDGCVFYVSSTASGESITPIILDEH